VTRTVGQATQSLIDGRCLVLAAVRGLGNRTQSPRLARGRRRRRPGCGEPAADPRGIEDAVAEDDVEATEILHALLDVGLSRIDRWQWAPKFSDVLGARFRNDDGAATIGEEKPVRRPTPAPISRTGRPSTARSSDWRCSSGAPLTSSAEAVSKHSVHLWARLGGEFAERDQVRRAAALTSDVSRLASRYFTTHGSS
jgi:hypothetical protein